MRSPDDRPPRTELRGPSLPETVHYTSISCAEGRRLGYGADELGEFDEDEALGHIEDTLRGIGINPVRMAWGGALVRELVTSPPTLLWNLNSGVLGEVRTAQVSALCEMLAIPMVGSGSWTAGLVQDKTATHRFLAASGLSVRSPRGLLVCAPGDIERRPRPFPGPYVLKPNNDESSRGLGYIDAGEPWRAIGALIASSIQAWGPMRLEEYVTGVDVTANAVVDEQGRMSALDPLVVEHGGRLYGAVEKTEMRHSLTPLRHLDAAMADAVRILVDGLCHLLRFRHYARFDFRCEPESGQIVFLEANYCPCFDRDGDFAASAAASGIPYEQLLALILAAAERDRLSGTWFAQLPAPIRRSWQPTNLAAHVRDS